WSQIVIWTSVAGTFLAVTGLYVGISRLRRANSRWSPYRGLWYWHHLTGLVFGLLVLTWVFSGLLTMGPFDIAGSSGQSRDYRAEVQGEISATQLQAFLAALESNPALSVRDIVELRAAPFGDELFVMATDADGSQL